MTVGMYAVVFTLAESTIRSLVNGVRVGKRNFHINTITRVTTGSLMKGWTLLRTFAGYREADRGSHGVIPKTWVYDGTYATFPFVIVSIINSCIR